MFSKTILLSISILALSAYAKQPDAQLKLSTHNCTSPCTVTLDGSTSKSEPGKTINKYIFSIGNGDVIESATPSIEYTYINFVQDNDPRKQDLYKKLKKAIDWVHKKFGKLKKFEPSLKIVQSDNKSSAETKQSLQVKGTSVLPLIDGEDFVPPKPDQKLSDSTLLGIDVDEDLVRDDVEVWINKNFTRSNARKGLKQFASRSQESISFSNDKT